VVRHRLRGRTLILAYHGIIPRGERAAGERALYVDQHTFGAQLDRVREVARVVPLDRVDDEPQNEIRVAISFDDAYQGAVTAGVEELAQRQLPATIFVAPGRLNGHVFWWDALAHRTGALDPAFRERALGEFDGIDERVRAFAHQSRDAGSDDLPAFARAASVAELDAAVLRHGGITFGSHTWSHPNVARLDAAALREQMERPAEWLRQRYERHYIPWIAYPYGLESPLARDAAARAGYVGGLCITGGWHVATSVSRFARPRLNVSGGLSPNGFGARLNGTITG
jgi:peptidoglycan/xylan/chitin deacetylase (PgdA/CDA1 family)